MKPTNNIVKLVLSGFLIFQLGCDFSDTNSQGILSIHYTELPFFDSIVVKYKNVLIQVTKWDSTYYHDDGRIISYRDSSTFSQSDSLLFKQINIPGQSIGYDGYFSYKLSETIQVFDTLIFWKQVSDKKFGYVKVEDVQLVHVPYEINPDSSITVSLHGKSINDYVKIIYGDNYLQGLTRYYDHYLIYQLFFAGSTDSSMLTLQFYK